MRQFKIIDFWISVVLIFGSFIYGVKEGLNFFAGYFIVGAWQVISILVHYYKNWFCIQDGSRSTYQKLVVIIFIIAAVGFVLNVILFILLFILAFAAPVMAVFYTWLCYKETFIKMQRPLAVLK